MPRLIATLLLATTLTACADYQQAAPVDEVVSATLPPAGDPQ